MTDRNGNTIDKATDRFTFDPPKYPGERDYYKHERGRIVQIREIITYGNVPTVELKSKDLVMTQFLRENRAAGVCHRFPLSYLRLID